MAQFNVTEVEKSLALVMFPADKESILLQVSKSGADQACIDIVNTLPLGIYASTEEIIVALRNVDQAVMEASEEVD